MSELGGRQRPGYPGDHSNIGDSYTPNFNPDQILERGPSLTYTQSDEPPTWNLPKRVATFTGIGLAVATTTAILTAPPIEVSGTPVPFEPAPAATPPQTPIEQRSVEMFSFRSDLTSMAYGGKDEAQKAATRIPLIAGGNSAIDNALQKALDYRKASTIAQYPAYDSGNDQRLSSASITDLGLRKSVDTITYTMNADDILKKTSTRTSADLQEGRTKLDQLPVPEGAATIKKDAQTALEIEWADGVWRDGQYLLDEPKYKQEFDDKIAQLTDPDIKQRISVVIERHTAATILKNVFLKKTSVADALTATASLKDGALRQQVLNSLTAPTDEYGTIDYERSPSSVATDIELGTANYIQANLSVDASPFSATDKAQAKTATDSIQSQAYKTIDEAELTYGRTIAAENKPNSALTPEALEQEPDPNERINLKGVPTQDVHNYSHDISNANADTDTTPEAFKQFGEVRMRSGEIVVNFQDGVDRHVQQQFRDSIRRMSPILRAAFASGNLTAVRLTLDKNFNPYFDNASREMIMNLAADDPLSVDQFDTAITHESTHSIFRNYFRNLDVSPEQEDALVNACYNLQNVMYESIQGSLSYSPEIFANLRAVAKPEHQAIVDALASSIQNRTLAQDFNLKPTYLDSTLSNRCDYTGDSLGLFLTAAVKQSKGTIKSEDIKYLLESDAYKAFADRISLDTDYGSVFYKVINEARYVKTDSSEKLFLGHSRENANELFASLFDVALNYPAELKDGLSKLEERDRNAVLQVMKVLLDAAQAEAPELLPMIQHTRKNFGLAG